MYKRYGAGVLLIFLLGCKAAQNSVDPYYLSVPNDKQEQLKTLFTLLERARVSDASTKEERFSLTGEIANIYLKQEQYGVLNTFLSAQINAEPDSSYNVYYLLLTAYSYILQDAPQAAALYFEIILKNHTDILVKGRSVHFVCLNQLLNLIQDPNRRAKYYSELIARFPDDTDLGTAYFMLGQAYEQTGEWNLAIKAYTDFRKFLNSHDDYNTANIPFPNAEHYAKQMVDFNNSAKDWTFDSLNALVNAVKFSLASGNSGQLWRYHAKVNFFVRSWAQDELDDSGLAEFNLPDFMYGSELKYADSLDSSSNASEAYLRTWGWTQFIPTWYLYFRKIYFPLDPNIHGRWEWAGVYYGEKF
jgi:tetratricopeptide (TPR) repeat protein